MKIQSNIIYIKGVETSHPALSNIIFTDADNTRICIDTKTLVHLYDIAKFNAEKSKVNWEEYTNSLFEKNEITNNE